MSNKEFRAAIKDLTKQMDRARLEGKIEQYVSLQGDMAAILTKQYRG